MAENFRNFDAKFKHLSNFFPSKIIFGKKQTQNFP